MQIEHGINYVSEGRLASRGIAKLGLRVTVLFPLEEPVLALS